jgi:magnesium transporter
MQVWQIGPQQAVALGELPARWPEEGFVWLTISRDDLAGFMPILQRHLAQVGKPPLLDLHVTDLLNEQLPSHFDSTAAYDLLVLQRLGVGDDPDRSRVDTRAIGFAIYPKLLLSVHPGGCPVQGQFIDRLLAKNNGRLPISSDELMLRMANQVVDSYLDLRRQLTKQYGELQQALIDTRNPFQNWAELLASRDHLLRLEDLCEDQQAAVQEWLDALAEWPAGEGPPEQEHLRVRGRDLLEHIARVLTHIRRLASSTESAVQMHYAALGHRTNNIMRVLTALTAVFLPLNLITGIFGMNFDALPYIHDARGVWLAFGLMGAVGVGLLWWFQRKRYLGSR